MGISNLLWKGEIFNYMTLGQMVNHAEKLIFLLHTNNNINSNWIKNKYVNQNDFFELLD